MELPARSCHFKQTVNFYAYRLLLFQEKEQLLRELRSQRGSREMACVQEEIKRLEQDLNNALEISNKAIADR